MVNSEDSINDSTYGYGLGAPVVAKKDNQKCSNFDDNKTENK